MAVDTSGRTPNINVGVLRKYPIRSNYDATGTVCGLAEFKPIEAVAIEDGGTGATTAEGARLNLEVFSETEVTDLIVHNIVHKDADYTAKDYEQVIVDTTAGAITVTLPTTPTDREVVVVQDGANNAQNNPITVNGNGETVLGVTDFIIDENSARYVFTYHTGEWRVGR